MSLLYACCANNPICLVGFFGSDTLALRKKALEKENN